MTIQVLQRDDWRGDPRKQGDLFELRKGKKRAICELWTHPLGWEVRLEASGELLRTQVCRSQDEVFATFESWKAAMVAKGWA